MVENYWLTLFHFALSLGFLALSGFALRDLLSGETTINVSKVYPEFVDTFPSFSVCTSTDFNFNANQLQNGVLNQIPFEVEITLTDLKLAGHAGRWGKIHILSKNSHIENPNFFKIHISEISFSSKFTFLKSHFSQIHISEISIFTKFTYLKSQFSQNSHF